MRHDASGRSGWKSAAEAPAVPFFPATAAVNIVLIIFFLLSNNFFFRCAFRFNPFRIVWFPFRSYGVHLSCEGEHTHTKLAASSTWNSARQCRIGPLWLIPALIDCSFGEGRITYRLDRLGRKYHQQHTHTKKHTLGDLLPSVLRCARCRQALVKLKFFSTNKLCMLNYHT